MANDAPSSNPVEAEDLRHVRKLGVLGDVHAETELLKITLNHFAAVGVEEIVAVGDLVDGPGGVNETLALLEANSVLAVAGNHDRWLLNGELRELPEASALGDVGPRARRYLRRLPRTRELATRIGCILLCHGLFENDFVGVKPDEPESDVLALPEMKRLQALARHALVLNGHTHRPMIRRFGKLSVVNAGTLHHAYRPTCSVLDLTAERCEVFDVNTEGVSLAASWPLDAERVFLPIGR